ncbi:MAG: hypothetical protein ACJAZ9_000083 [Neolewinella sp.]|jgi:hypothetical protein
MHRLSSNATLFLKIFLPVFWTTVLTGLTLASWLTPEQTVDLPSFRWAMAFLLTINVAFFFFILWPLKRVESDGEKVFVSNYFRTAFYSWEKDVEAVHVTRILLVKIATIELNGVGSFGQRMRFIPSKKLMQEFEEENPGVMSVVRD